MRPLTALFLLFLSVPVLEIYLLIQVGGAIGAAWTVLLVVFTAVLGAWLVRRQGLATLARVQATLARGALPAGGVVEGVLILLAGALLLTPGFFTDAVGFALLVPALRRALARQVLARGLWTVAPPPGPAGPGGGRTLEGEYRHDDD